MEREKAVEGAMLDFNTKFPLVEEELKIHIRYLFNLMWMAGWENRVTEWGKGNMRHPIQQLDRFGNVLRTFPSLTDASKELDYAYNSLKKALSRGSITHNGRFRWRYV